MSWKPRHDTHAVERVRLMLEFNGPLTTKLLQSATKEIVHSAKDLGFDTVQPAQSTIADIQVNPFPGGQSLNPQENGTVLKRHLDKSLVEEVGFRDGRFGYVTTEYRRWENLLGRLEHVMLPALKMLDDFADLQSVKLEYWDIFTYDGPLNEADAMQVLRPFEAGVPKDVVRGAPQWHSYVGWFEQHENFPLLINRHFDVVDQNVKSGPVRILAIYSMVELRKNEKGIAIGRLDNILQALHRRALKLFGESLSDQYRKVIGLDLKEYL